MYKKIEPEFWVTNISNRNVTLADLALNIKAYASINLLDKRHYSYTLEQLNKSVESGSIFNKRNKIIVRKVAPEILNPHIPMNHETYIPSRSRSGVDIKQEYYEELELSDEEFLENSEK